ncbi:N-acetyltransferase eco isoform X1 [Rhagoletis pomonella]|uniref:N-acetyltransferase eco isoform X1 n=2 Tax=Rhagoletis pomonella TaxID=28610 RepID=UPI00177D79A8|nr:N-acetyltransferase eco isoform X1 [Rhagoletis pomonella]
METPKSARKPKPARNPTPRLSERKKSLFVDRYSTLAGNDVMEGIELLDPSDSNMENKSVMTRSMRSIEPSLQSNCSTSISFLSDVSIGVKSSEYTSPLRRSPRNNVNKQSEGTLLKPVGGKENTLKYADLESADDQLQNMFNKSMRITSRHYENAKAETQKRNIEQVKESTGMSPRRKTAKFSMNDKELSSISTKKFYSASRPGNSHSEVQKQSSVLSKNTSSPPTMIKNISPRSRGRFERRSSGTVNINKGVKHKIRRPARPNISGGIYRKKLSSIEIDRILENLHNDNLKNRIALNREERQNIEKIHNIFRSCKNPIEMARPLTVISGMDDTNNNLTDYVLSPSKKNKEFKIDEIDADFSDIDSIFDEYEDLPNEEEIIPLISHQPASIEAALGESETEARTTTLTKRKFFKSGRSNHTPKEIHITDNIKASICNGKLSLIPEEKKTKKKPKRRPSTTYDITDEQATVEAILKNLNDTAYNDVGIDKDMKSISNSEQKQNHTAESGVIQLDSDRDYSNFRKRLPYNTNDPSVVEQQHLLLDFLINNNMCTEENFTIFIADPDNHKEEAARIVDQVFVLVNEQDYYRQRIPYNTSDSEIEMQQHRMLDFLIENNMCTEENFDIFIANYNLRHKEADEIMATIRNQGNGISSRSDLKIVLCDDTQPKKMITENNNDSKNTTSNIEISQATAKVIEPSSGGTLLPLPTTHSGDDTGAANYPIFNKQRWKPIQQQSTRNFARLWNLGQGTDQYQIDAGQTEFGAHQCKQCGLVYSIHEPEEEKLHNDYHASLNLLRFKGWIDEDIVAIYPEWGADGRILRITETSHSRRHERLADILKIVDKELGYSSYVIPQIFVAYLAVRKFQIVGVCLVVPLEKANKFLKVNGMDCCTEEVYPAKCGISRIWVSPLHRRLHIASKLIHAVQQNTIFGEEIPLERIAFSSPTENGRLFAQNATQMENFLVYQ